MHKQLPASSEERLAGKMFYEEKRRIFLKFFPLFKQGTAKHGSGGAY
jgi:hypothetical protein